jgi:amidase
MPLLPGSSSSVDGAPPVPEPTNVDTWIGRSAAQIAEAVRTGGAEPRAVVQQHLDRIERLNPQLGAFRRIRHGEALAEADAVAARPDLARLPLAGVPVAIKDNVEVIGEQLRNGSAAFPADVQDTDHPVVARLREAGAVVVGVTNVPELCLTPMTDSVYGIARNPWNRDRTPGGSSGGSAATVSAALVPLAHGNDGLGSIRIPAACCGLVGIKPGAGVVPPSITGEPAWYGLSENGPLATTVHDAALGLSVMAGDPGLAQLDDPGVLRIGVSVRPALAGLPIDPRSVAATVETGELLEGRGHKVSPHAGRYPAWLGPGTLRTWYSCAYKDALGLDRTKLDRRTRRMAATGRVLETLHFGGGGVRDRWRGGAADDFFGDIDVLLLPSLATIPPPARRYGDRGAIINTFISVRAAALYGAWNIAGWPAMNVPAGVHDVAGTPLSIQLVARPGGERLLLELAAQIEAARPWQRHAPEYRIET